MVKKRKSPGLEAVKHFMMGFAPVIAVGAIAITPPYLYTRQAKQQTEMAATIHEAKQKIERETQQRETEKRIQEAKQKIEREAQQQLELIVALPEFDREYFMFFQPSMKIKDTDATDQEGEKIEVKSLLEKSINGKEARDYARMLIDAIYIEYGGKRLDCLEDKVDLAKEVIDIARSRIQRRDYGGEGNYTLTYEYQGRLTHDELLIVEKKLDNLKCGEDKGCNEEAMALEKILHDGNSIQTYDEFYGPKEKPFFGDCDDFSMALTTLYYAVKDEAKSRKHKDPFYEKLSEGFEHYKITSIEVINHALNLEIININDVTYFKLIEPLCVDKNLSIISKENGVFIINHENNSTNKILKIYNREFSAEAKKSETKK